MNVITKLELEIFSKITEDLTRAWSIKNLAEEISHHYRPVYLAVKRLIRDKYLIINNNNLITPAYTDTVKLGMGEKKRVSDIKNKTIKIIYNRLLENIDSVFCCTILFGSSVKGKGKDIDLLFIIPDSFSTDKFKEKIEDALGSYSKLTDINIINEESAYEMLNRPNQINVMNEILKNHMVLIGHEIFYAIIRKWKNDR